MKQLINTINGFSNVELRFKMTKRLLIIFTVIFSLQACSEDFLNRDPKGNLTAETFFEMNNMPFGLPMPFMPIFGHGNIVVYHIWVPQTS